MGQIRVAKWANLHGRSGHFRLAKSAIAELVAKGYIRIIVTTNFDRLVEQALSERGVQPVIIASADAAQGALPLAHAPCTIIKVNGDYLDTRFRNTREELAAYEAPLERLLDQVLDEYGLIVCGWSGDWDIGLRAAIERCHTRRFSTYWAVRGDPGTRAVDLINLRSALTFSITDADAFFGGLLDKILALETFADQDPVSARVAVARVKRYLTSDTHRISLDDLLHSETDRAITGYSAARDARGLASGEALSNRLRQYEGALQVLLPVLASVAYWTEYQHDGLLVSCLQRVADEPAVEGGLTIWLNLRRYAALLLLYAMGVTAVARANGRLLRELLSAPVRLDPQESPVPAGIYLYNNQVLIPSARQIFPGREREHTPLNNHLFETLKEPLRNQLWDQRIYAECFSWWEYLTGLAFIDLKYSQAELARALEEDPRKTRIWAPVGRFVWEGRLNAVEQWSQIQDGKVPTFVAALLKEGFFVASRTLDPAKYQLVKRAMDEHVNAVRGELQIW